HCAEAAVVVIMQVRAADAAARKADLHLAGAGRGKGAFLDPQVLRGMDDDGFHGITLTGPGSAAAGRRNGPTGCRRRAGPWPCESPPCRKPYAAARARCRARGSAG